ncbi:hypothetical protein FHX82_005430 [Amycolatopsis bartoniae]|uniref:Uncharacterized protein n=1 Tax=Amycolatopsis bartoniae TaxID=941986 RepID=A0A8H9IPD5_9PSEU|nr:hypothetical protein [Amycolatopsis bartoniae]MBB2938354.1 hypothetical protein [Amycolatopsis bartoniae]TVS99231.1 hypothetical protein FNH07_35480 [Amycolatopsis bartoniae]GHF34558.1 hypothetical protein GCM10017566_04080 [Amycolatopsis bartoniae]
MLARTRDLGPAAVVPFTLHLSWLRPERLPVLVEEVTTADIPIAVVLERDHDPLGLKYAVYGLVVLLQVLVPRLGVIRPQLALDAPMAAALGHSGASLWPLVNLLAVELWIRSWQTA